MNHHFTNLVPIQLHVDRLQYTIHTNFLTEPYFTPTSRPSLRHTSIDIPADTGTAALFLGGVGMDKIPESIGEPSAVCTISHITVFHTLVCAPINEPIVGTRT